MSVENTSNVGRVDVPSTSSRDRMDILDETIRTQCYHQSVIVEGPYTPEYATDGSAGFDLRYSFSPLGEETWMEWLEEVYTQLELAPGQTLKIPTGLKFKIPYGSEIQIRPRSGLASMGIVAQFGTVDSDYRGEVSVILHNQSNTHHLVQHGDRIAQGVLAPVTRAYFVEGRVTADTSRGEGGFGSTGN